MNGLPGQPSPADVAEVVKTLVEMAQPCRCSRSRQDFREDRKKPKLRPVRQQKLLNGKEQWARETRIQLAWQENPQYANDWL